MKNKIISAFLAFALIMTGVAAPQFKGVINSASASAPFSKGCILPGGVEPTIFDALEILKYLVKIPNEIDKGGVGSRAWNAAVIRPGASAPDIFDALEILKYLVCMENEIGVNPRPSSPQDLRAVPGDRQVMLSWKAPQSSGKSAIIYYQVSKDGVTWINIEPKYTNFTFTELTNVTNYTFSVRAVNATHTGAAVTVSATAGSEFDIMAAEVVKLVNAERAFIGLPPVSGDDRTLNEAAAKRAREIVTLFSHSRPDGREFYSVFGDYGIAWNGVAENIGDGYASPEAVMYGWMTSPGHCANIMNPKFSSIGVGVVRSGNGTLYWVQLFKY